MGVEHRAAALAAFTRLAAESLLVLPVERSAFPTAARFADQHGVNLRAGDALHLAICGKRCVCPTLPSPSINLEILRIDC